MLPLPPGVHLKESSWNVVAERQTALASRRFLLGWVRLALPSSSSPKPPSPLPLCTTSSVRGSSPPPPPSFSFSASFVIPPPHSLSESTEEDLSFVTRAKQGDNRLFGGLLSLSSTFLRLEPRGRSRHAARSLANCAFLLVSPCCRRSAFCRPFFSLSSFPLLFLFSFKFFFPTIQLLRIRRSSVDSLSLLPSSSESSAFFFFSGSDCVLPLLATSFCSLLLLLLLLSFLDQSHLQKFETFSLLFFPLFFVFLSPLCSRGVDIEGYLASLQLFFSFLTKPSVFRLASLPFSFLRLCLSPLFIFSVSFPLRAFIYLPPSLFPLSSCVRCFFLHCNSASISRGQSVFAFVLFFSSFVSPSSSSLSRRRALSPTRVPAIFFIVFCPPLFSLFFLLRPVCQRREEERNLEKNAEEEGELFLLSRLRDRLLSCFLAARDIYVVLCSSSADVRCSLQLFRRLTSEGGRRNNPLQPTDPSRLLSRDFFNMSPYQYLFKYIIIGDTGDCARNLFFFFSGHAL